MNAKGTYCPSLIHLDEICIPASFQLVDGKLPFAYGDIKRDSSILFNSQIEQLVNQLILRNCLGELSSVVNSSKAVNCGSFPVLYNQLNYCIDKICINEKIELLICPELKDINGFSFELQGIAYVMIGFRVLSELTLDEFRFLLGHELGHVVIGHLNYHMVCGLIKSRHLSSFPFGTTISNKIEDEYNRWCQDSEYTADRAGLICCGNIDVVSSLIEKICYTKQGGLASKGLFSSHPQTPNRMEQLRLFQRIIHNKHI